MDDQSLGGLVDGELLGSVDEDLAPESEDAARNETRSASRFSLLPPSEKRCSHSLLALVLVRTLESIHLDELVERSPDAAAGPNLNGEIEERVEGVGRVVTFRAGDSGTKTTSEELMDRGGVLEIAVDVPAEERKRQKRLRKEEGEGEVSSSSRRGGTRKSPLD